MDPVEILRDGSCLVALNAAYEVPLGPMLTKLPDFVEGVLQVVFPEGSLSCVERLNDIGRGPGLADGETR